MYQEKIIILNKGWIAETTKIKELKVNLSTIRQWICVF